MRQALAAIGCMLGGGTLAMAGMPGVSLGALAVPNGLPDGVAFLVLGIGLVYVAVRRDRARP